MPDVATATSVLSQTLAFFLFFLYFYHPATRSPGWRQNLVFGLVGGG